MEQGSLLFLAYDSGGSVRGDGEGGGGDGRKGRLIWRREAEVWSGSWLSVQVLGLTESLCCVCPAGLHFLLMTPWSLTGIQEH